MDDPIIILIAHNIRSAYNVGSLLRTADGLGVAVVYLSGYSPYPSYPGDRRLPHESRHVNSAVHKTALGAERTVSWRHHENIETLLDELQHEHFTLAGLEQSPLSRPLHAFSAPSKIALLLGEEVSGLHEHLVSRCDVLLQIPMFGSKESFNVAEAADRLPS
jgi:tRNA G18 (ribose-2'-O)-methylase SpoU